MPPVVNPSMHSAYSSSGGACGLDSSSFTMSSLTLALACWAAINSAFMMARSPELPWQMMHMPSIPKSGAPPWEL